MKLTNLRMLHIDMQSNGITRQKFAFSFKNTLFDVLFFSDDVPMTLLFGVVGRNFSFEISVGADYCIATQISSEIYTKLIEVLAIEYNPESPFRPWHFFSAFSESIPVHASKRSVPEPHDVAQYRRVVLDSKKIYFLGWRNNNKEGGHVTPDNLEKTKLLLGINTWKKCKEKNISSRWTDIPIDAVAVTEPS